MNKVYDIYIDGACKGNPGQAAVGVVIFHADKVIKEISEPIGEATNNIAEYSALIRALEEAQALKAQRIHFFTDSELVFKQVTGSYQVKNPTLQELFAQVADLSKFFESIEIKHIPRAQNSRADKLATSALKNKQAKVVAPLFKCSEEESPSSRG